MISELIEKFIQDESRKGIPVNIHFKERNIVNGIFVFEKDYSELKSKNFWRVVHKSKIDQWKESHDIDLSRIFNGTTFTRLSDES